MKKFAGVLLGVSVLFSCLCFDAGISPALGTGPLPEGNLPEDLTGLTIRDRYLPSPFKRVGAIHAMNGQVVVIHRATKEAYFAAAGDALHENDMIRTLGQSRCRIRLTDEDVITMASDTSFSVESYEDRREESKKESLFSMLKGKAMFYALRLFRYRDARFTLKTPTAVVGVRGTKFGAHVYRKEGGEAARGGVQVADKEAGAGFRQAQLSPEPGAGTVTDCFSEDGILDINGTPVLPGQLYQGETGAVMPTPPAVVKAFEEETAVKTEGEGEGTGTTTGEGEGKEGEGQGEGETTKEGGEGEKEGEEGETTFAAVTEEGGGIMDPGAITEIMEKVTETTQQTVTEEAAGGGGVEEIAKGKTAGEISLIALLITDGGGIAWTGAGPKIPLYVSQEVNIFTGGAETHVAYEALHKDDPNYKITLQEQTDTNMDVDITQFGWGSAATLANHTFTWHKVGSWSDENGHEYLTWGYWQDQNAPVGKIGTAGGDYYAAAAQIWEVEGRPTHADYIDYLHRQGASYGYSGVAPGVFANSTVPDVRILAGNFSCNVNFGSMQVSNFNLTATQGEGGPVVVQMTGGSGALDSGGGFDIRNFSGTFFGSEALSASNSGASGGCAGGKAEAVAGVWWANGGASSQYWATGEFHGKR
ncbi:MAG: FecR domain-containing protein [Deltaproteobacteria bacterium]|nr:FecR domain-containing protein [Deltaproteobacteria bacterium]